MKQKKAILLVANFSNGTGYAWKFIYRIFNVIAKNLNDHNIFICLSFSKIVEPVKILDDDIPFHSFEFDPINIRFSELLHLRKKIKQYNIKYVYFTDKGSWSLLYALLRIWGVEKIITHSHVSSPNPDPPPSETGIRKVIKSYLNHIDLITANSVYTVSDFVKDRFIRKACCPSYKITKILNGIDIDQYHSLKPSGNEKGEKIKIFAACRATKFKGIQVLIKAVKSLHDRYETPHFIVEYAGDGPDLDEFKMQVKNLQIENSFKFLGPLSDIKNNIGLADIIVIPSIWGDACPLAVMEGMAAGKAIVATNVGGISEIVGGNENAMIVPHSESEPLAKAIFELLINKNKRDRLGLNARLRAEEAFDQTRFHKTIVQHVYKDLEIL